MDPLPIPPRQECVTILSNEKAGDDAFIIRLRSDYFSKEALPGQFFHVRVTDTLEPLLRRPLSLHRRCQNSGCVALFYKLKGIGTRLLAQRKEGETIDVIGPLGTGFPQPKGRTYLVGGGMGVAPFPAVVDRLNSPADQLIAFIGAKTASALLCVEELESMGVDVRTATDDGSSGYHGSIPDLVFSLDPPDTMFCCGPNSMVKALVLYSLENGIDCWASVEERMACGMGMCRACAIRLTEENGQSYGRVCTDGPVFPAHRLSDWARQE